MYVGFIGKLFLNVLKSLIVPLIIPSLIATIGGMDLALSGKIGLRAIIYYMTTTVMAVILGIFLVETISPGVPDGSMEEKSEIKKEYNSTVPDTLMDLVRNCFPENIARATMFQKRTEILYPEDLSINGSKTDNTTGASIKENDPYTWPIKDSDDYQDNPNILGLVVVSIVMGIAISAAGEEGKFLLKLFQSIADVMMKVTSWVISCSPVGVLFIVAGQVVEHGNPKELEKVAMYFGTVIAGLTIHGFIVLPLIYAAVTRSLPFRFIGNMVEALMTAWGTASSTATLPVTIRCLEQKNNINPIISRFVLPIGATINMDGTALYEAVAAIFISQMTGYDMSMGRKVAVFITAMAGSIGAAGIPQGGLVTLAMVLEAAGLPSENLGLILSVDWLLDRFQTSMNVLGDSIGAAIVSHCSKKDLEALEIARKNIDMA